MIYWAIKHQCVSCQYWVGERNVQKDSRVVECTPGTKGICMGSNRTFRGKQVDCSTRCGNPSCFQLWYPLNER